MSSAEDILTKTLNETGTDSSIIVDFSTRKISIPDSIKHLGVESDDDVTILDFAIPRYFNDIDLSEFTVHINYLNAKNEGDVYTADDVVLDDNNITFSWTVGRYALAFDGDVCFNVCLKKWDTVDPTIVIQELNTMVATLPVLPGLETSEAVIQKYADVLAAWEAKLFGMGDTLETNLSNTTSKLQAELIAKADLLTKTAKQDIVNQGEATCATVDARVEVAISEFLNNNPSAIITDEEYDILLNSIK